LSNETLRATVLEYIKQHHTMTLATTLDNQPWATPIFYASDGFKLYFLSSPRTSRHGKNLSANPKVSASITEDYPLKQLNDWQKIQGIQLEGIAKLLVNEAELAQVVTVYVTKYPFTAPYLKGMFTFPRVMAILEKASHNLKLISNFRASLENRFYELVPEKIWFVDNKTSFEKRREVSF